MMRATPFLLAGALALGQVAAALAARPASYAAAVDAADLGDPDAEFAVGEAEGHELAWYGVQELPFVLELMD